jgi:SAM-dependent methyltransferase
MSEMIVLVQPRDAMQFVNEQDDATLERFIQRLEFRGADETFVGYRDAYMALVDLAAAGAVVDLGCGTGVVARAVAAREEFGGTVTGIDQSPVFIAAAERFAAGEGVADRIEFVVGDVHALPFADASFDVAIAHTLVSHVPDPLAVVSEAARVVRPGGTVAIFDGDYASLTFGCRDLELARAMEAGIQSIVMSTPRVMRDLPRVLRQAGLRLTATQAHVYAEAGAGDFMLNLAETYGPIAGASGAVPAGEVEAWLADQRRAAQDGTFFAACNYYAYVATQE